MHSQHRRSSTAWPRAIALCGFAALAAIGSACAPVVNRPDVMIGTASPTEIYYPLGGSICRLLNLGTSRHGLRCAEEPSSGAVTNIESLRRGRLDIGIVPSDVLADACIEIGLGSWHRAVGQLALGWSESLSRITAGPGRPAGPLSLPAPC